MKPQIERAGKDDPVEDPRKVLFHLFAADARDRTAVLADILGYLLRIERDLRVEIREENDEGHVQGVVPESVGAQPVRKIAQPP